MSDSFPQGPSLTDLVALAGTFAADPAGLLQQLVADHGNVVGIDLPDARLVIVNQPDLARTLLLELQHDTNKGRALQRSKPLLGEGLLTSEGDGHARARRLLAPAFHRPRLARYGETISSCIDDELAQWPDATATDVHQHASRLMLDIVGRTLFGVDLRRDAGGISQALDAAIGWFGRQPGFGLTTLVDDDPELQMAVEHLDNVVGSLITARRADQTHGDDLLSALIATRDDEGDGGGLTDVEIRDHTMTLLLAGHETTANALSWTLGLLATHPEVQAKLRDEATTAFDSGATANEIASLPFVRAVVSEGLRLYPPAWIIARQVVNPIELGPWSLPAGTTVAISPWLLHHDELWFDAPDQFDPQRWLDGRTADLPRGAFLPFGAGTRSCIGEQLAWLELGVALAKLTAARTLSPCDSTSFAREHAITLRPRYGMWLTTDAVSPKCLVNLHFVAPPAGLEPATCGLGNRCSIH